MLDAGPHRPYLVARMKRLLALLALVLGMTYVIAPAHARVTVSAECSEPVGHYNAPSAQSANRGETVSARTRQQRNRQLGKPCTATVRTIVLPTVMLVDRPLE